MPKIAETTCQNFDTYISKRGSLDVRKAFKLFFSDGYPEADIARICGVTRQAVNHALRPFKLLVDNPEKIQAFREQKTNILDALEADCVGLLLDKDKRKKATFGNVGYVLDKIHGINRLEKGLSTLNVLYSDMTRQEQAIEEEIRQLEASLKPQDVVFEGEVLPEVTEPGL